MNMTKHLQENWQTILLVILIIIGIVLEYFNIVDWKLFLEWARETQHQIWLPVLLITIQIILFMFALPGSSMLWVIAPIYEPILASLYLVVGSTLGGVAAYWFVQYVRSPLISKIQKHHLFQSLKVRSDFITLFSLRVFPGFPHSLINYSSGILGVPLIVFISSAVLGIGIKTYLYASVIHRAINTSDMSELVRAEVIGPLLVIVGMALLAKLVKSKRHHQ